MRGPAPAAASHGLEQVPAAAEQNLNAAVSAQRNLRTRVTPPLMMLSVFEDCPRPAHDQVRAVLPNMDSQSTPKATLSRTYGERRPDGTAAGGTASAWLYDMSR